MALDGLFFFFLHSMSPHKQTIVSINLTIHGTEKAWRIILQQYNVFCTIHLHAQSVWALCIPR